MSDWWDQDPVATQAAPKDGKWWEADPVAGAASLTTPEAPARSDGRQNGVMNAAARGFVDGIPIAGPVLLGAIDKGDAAVRALTNDTKYSDEVSRAADYGKQVEGEHPYAHLAGEIGGGVAGTAPLVAAWPAAFGSSAAALPVRMAASALSGAALGGTDAAIRSGGDLSAVKTGLELGGGIGAAGPAVGRGVGKVVETVTGGEPGMHMIRQAIRGFTPSELESAQFLRDQAASLPGSGVDLSVAEALNAVTGGKANRLSQIERVAANSGGEGGQIAGEFYAARPAQVDNSFRATADRIGEQSASPTNLGFDVQRAAQAGVAQTPEGMALTAARQAAGPRVTPEQAGQTIQTDLRARQNALEATREAQANTDYAAARAAPENVGIERTVTVERPGEPVVTQLQYSRPQFMNQAPAPLGPPPGRADGAIQEAGPMSLGRFVAQNGGLPLEGDVLATDLHKFNIPGLGNVARQGGKSIDNFWRERLIEEGYLRPDADGGMARDISSDLLRKLQNEQRGFPSYPIGSNRSMGTGPTAGQLGDEYANALSHAETRLDGDLRGAGIDPAGVHPEIRSRTLGALMRGESAEPLDAFERVVGGLREPPAPFVKSTTVQEQIPDVRFGQVDPRPAVAAVTEQARTAKGDVRGALAAADRDLREPGGDLDMSVEGLLHARERLDFGIQAAREAGDATKVRDLQIARSRLDGSLKQVPEVAQADANFAANSRPLDPFQGNAPLAQVTRQDPLTGRLAMPAEQVPGMVQGPTAAREVLANGTPAAREALGRRLQTQILDAATEPDGTVAVRTIRTHMLTHEDTLAQLPEVRDALAGIARARDGMVRVEASPLGQIAASPEVKRATDVLFAANPPPGSHSEVASAMGALARNNRSVAEQLARHFMESTFNEATQMRRGLEAQYGGAGWASFIRGNSQQARNLEATVRALPDGDARWTALDRLATTLEATGFRPQKGSDTTFNTALQKELATGKTPIGQAISDALAGGAAGTAVGGPKAGLAGMVVGAKRGIGDTITHARMLNNGEAIARLMFDRKALPDLRALAQSKPGSRNAELFSARLLSLANGGAGELRQSAAR